MSDYLTVCAVALRLRRDRTNVRRYCRMGLMPGSVKLGRDWLIPEAAVEAFVYPLAGNPNWRGKP